MRVIGPPGSFGAPDQHQRLIGGAGEPAGKGIGPVQAGPPIAVLPQQAVGRAQNVDAGLGGESHTGILAEKNEIS